MGECRTASGEASGSIEAQLSDVVSGVAESKEAPTSGTGQTAVVMRIDDLGFTRAYEVETDPEFPGDGDWSCPTIGFASGGVHGPFLESRFGAPLLVRVRPIGGAEWVASFAAGSGGTTFNGIFGSPSPDHAVIVVDGQATLINAASPLAEPLSVGSMVTDVVGLPAVDAVLVVRFFDLIRVGKHGIAWRSRRLCLDDLRIDEVTSDRVVCSGEFIPRDTIVVDLDTGQRLSGPDFADAWPEA